jgi:hypothetical protein
VALERVVLVGRYQGEDVVISRVSWAVRDPETDILYLGGIMALTISGVRYEKLVMYLLHQLYLSLVIVCLNKFSYMIFSKKGVTYIQYGLNLLYSVQMYSYKYIGSFGCIWTCISSTVLYKNTYLCDHTENYKVLSDFQTALNTIIVFVCLYLVFSIGDTVLYFTTSLEKRVFCTILYSPPTLAVIIKKIFCSLYFNRETSTWAENLIKPRQKKCLNPNTYALDFYN